MISFAQIPVDIRVPGQYIEFDNSRAVAGLPAVHHKIMVLGQRLSTGTVAANTPTRILSAAQAEASFGRGSMLSAMFNALKAANYYTETWAVGIDDANAGVKQTKTLTVTGPATETRTLNLYIAGIQVQVLVTSGDSANEVAAAIHAAVNAKTELPMVASLATPPTHVVTLTAVHKGEAGAQLDVRHSYYYGEKLPAGIGLAIASGTAGTGNPDITDALASMAGEQYHTIIMPYTDAANLAILESELETRWGPLAQQDGMAFAAFTGTHADTDSLGSSRNSPYLSIIGGGESPTPPWIWAAVTGAIDAYEPDPARPRQTLALPGVLPPSADKLYTYAERNVLLHDGISTYRVDQGGNVTIERLITTYQTNAYSVDDISYLDIETMRTLAYLRYSVRARIALRYPRAKLANDGTNFGPGQSIVTPSLIRAELVALFMQWEEAGLAEDIEQFKRDLIVERNATDPNRVDALIPPNVINQFRVFAAAVQFRL